MYARLIRPQVQRGATLIEVLVTLLVLSVGLLGMAGLQALSIKSNQSAYYRSQATFLAYDITERMRSEEGACTEQKYDLSEVLPGGEGETKCSDSILVVRVNWDDSRGSIQGAPKNEPSSEEESALNEFFEYRTRL